MEEYNANIIWILIMIVLFLLVWGLVKLEERNQELDEH